jgi:hypothetical protein
MFLFQRSLGANRRIRGDLTALNETFGQEATSGAFLAETAESLREVRQATEDIAYRTGIARTVSPVVAPIVADNKVTTVDSLYCPVRRPRPETTHSDPAPCRLTTALLLRHDV